MIHVLHPSKDQALQILLCVERKMDHDPAYAEQYCAKIEDYLVKGYAKELSAKEAAVEGPRTWYLPHFTVVNPNKPGKMHFILDAASRVRGTSFNDALLPGPDFLTSLFGVLL